ncbi:hypothetical protein COB57_03750 [Candidatus Peregrinibacteria bacterium]|nr:MAG: hypothetical protein COB57_03750 [Candidatus Peregrinibacteria bacterium]
MKQTTFQGFQRLFKKNPWQTKHWAEFQKQIGNTVFFLGDGESSALVIKKQLFKNWTYLEVPYGPLGKPDDFFWKELKLLAKKENAVFSYISPQEKIQNFPSLSVKSALSHFPKFTRILNLSNDEEEILKQMKSKGRYNIRVAQRHKVYVEESRDINAFCQLLEETTSRDGFSQNYKKHYEALLHSDVEKVKMFFALWKDESQTVHLLSAGIFILDQESCLYYYGASSNQHRDKMAPYLLQWHVIDQAKKQGCEEYDFFGIANPLNEKNDPLSGPSRFKKQFGGEVIEYSQAYDIINKPLVYFTYRCIRSARSLYKNLIYTFTNIYK